ncbi:hypothetical protein Tco_0854935 [Tanacetum coccineum]
MVEMGRNEQKQLKNLRNESRDLFLLVSWLLLAVKFLLNLPWTCLDHDLSGGVISIIKGGDGGGSVHYGGDKVFSWSARVQGGDGGGSVHYGGDKVFSWSARVQRGDGGGRMAARW